MKNKNIRHIWSVICSQSTIDSESKNVSLSNLIERITLQVPEADLRTAKEAAADGILFPFQFEVVSRFMRLSEKTVDPFIYRLTMTNPDGKPMLHSNEQEVTFAEGIVNMRIRTRLDQLPVQKAGHYEIIVETKPVNEGKYTKVESIPLEILLKTT